MTEAVVALAPARGMTAAVCAALGVSRASVQRRRSRLAAPPAIDRQRAKPTRALSDPQQQVVLELLHAPRFADQAPAEIYASLLDEGVYHCSIRTMYRILGQHGEVRERREQLRHPAYRKPELIAELPNQVWSWDITKLMGPTKWSYFYLYVILDIFSRRVVGWCVADAESAALFRPLFDDAIAKHNVLPGQLTLHADRGGPMKAKATALLLADLGVTRSHNRPHTSNDNPFSESHFKTLKYQPRFPQRFGCIEDAKSFCRRFFDWYNQQHHHAGIGLMTPDQVHYGQTDAIHAARQNTLDRAFRNNPERFVNKPPTPPDKPTAAWINPPSVNAEDPSLNADPGCIKVVDTFRFTWRWAMNKDPQTLYGVFSEGMDSYLHELPRDSCPYPLGSTEREAWLGGWDQTEYGKRYSHSGLPLSEGIRVQRPTPAASLSC